MNTRLYKLKIAINGQDWVATIYDEHISLQLEGGYSTSLTLTTKGIMVKDSSDSPYHSFKPTARTLEEWDNILVEAETLIQEHLLTS